MARSIGAMALAYLITWRCYGTYLHGEPGAVRRGADVYGEALPEPSPRLRETERAAMRQAPMILDERMRAVVTEAIERTSEDKGWVLMACNVRTNHVHVVVAVDRPPEAVMTTLKSWATRYLRMVGLVGLDRRVWARHGSTRYLVDEASVARAMYYVTDMQDGERFE